MNAIILVGGLGTRLKSEVKNIPKPMAPIGDKPFLEILMNKLSACGFKKIILCTGYKSEVIRDYFLYKYKEMEISYSNEKKQMGTGGAIKLALDKIDKEEHIFIFNGDTFFDIDYSELKNFHIDNNFSLTIALKEMNKFDRYGNVDIDSNFRINSFNKKKFTEKGFINTGIYLTKYETLKKLPIEEVFSFENDFLNKVHSKYDFGGYISNGFFIDIGIPEDYLKARRILNE